MNPSQRPTVLPVDPYLNQRGLWEMLMAADRRLVARLAAAPAPVDRPEALTERTFLRRLFYGLVSVVVVVDVVLALMK